LQRVGLGLADSAEVPPKRSPRLDPYRDVIDTGLRDDLDAPRKQRHTAKRIFDRLLNEHNAAGVVSYWMVRQYIATRRGEIRIEAEREPANTLPLMSRSDLPHADDLERFVTPRVVILT
jgi:hypothetical protein